MKIKTYQNCDLKKAVIKNEKNNISVCSHYKQISNIELYLVSKTSEYQANTDTTKKLVNKKMQ